MITANSAYCNETNLKMAPAFSKPIARKTATLDERVTTNPRHKAPIPLYPEPSNGTTTDTIKLKLSRNPSDPNSPKYEKAYHPFDGATTEDYCRFLMLLEEYEKQAPLSTVEEKFNAVPMFLTGASATNWSTALKLIEDEYLLNNTAMNYNDKDAYEKVISQFGLNYCKKNAAYEQKVFMNRRLACPNDIDSRTYYGRIIFMNRCIPMLNGNKKAFDAMELREIFMHGQSESVVETMKQVNYQWELPEYSTNDLIDYVDNLRLIGANFKDKKSPHKGKKDSNKYKHDRNNGGKKKDGKTCTYCKKYGHTEDVCRKKKYVESKKNKDEEEQNRMEADDAELEQLQREIDELDKTMVRSQELFNQTTQSTTILTDHTSSSDLGTVVRIAIKSKDKSGNDIEKIYRCLIDTGCSRTVVVRKAIPDDVFEQNKRSRETIWTTNGGKFTTKNEATISFSMVDFAPSKLIEFPVAVDESNRDSKYDMILGRDLQRRLKIDILWSKECLIWDSISIPMTTIDAINQIVDAVDNDTLSAEEVAMHEELFAATKILDAKYEKPDISATVDTYTHLSIAERTKLKTLLYKFEDLFQGTLGEWNTAPVDLELKDGMKPPYLRPFPVPIIHEQTLRKEIDRLIKIGVLRKVGACENASPSFIIPKKDGTIRFVSDFRVLNAMLKDKQFPLPKVQDMLHSLGGFTYATSIDLNMGYYNIRLTRNASDLCTIVFPFGTYAYNRLAMGVKPAPGIFQAKMHELMADLEYVKAYIDDCLCVTKGSYDDHLEKLEQVLLRLRKANLQIKINKCEFCQSELEYLGYIVTNTGIRPLADKVEAIQRLKPPKTLTQLRSFLGMVNYYRDMWKRRSHLLAPLTELTKVPKGSKKKFVWTDKQQSAFNEVKKSISANTMLMFPQFDKPFDIHTDASDEQLGAVISQDGKPVAFYSRKLNPAQRNYTVGEREMLSIVETMKEYRNILLGRKINIYTDHRNLVKSTTISASPRVQRWRLVVEEFGPEFHYIQGPKNVVADALSRLESDDGYSAKLDTISESYLQQADDTIPEGGLPISTRTIALEQQKDLVLQRQLNRHPDYFSKSVHGTEVILFNDKIYVPKSIRTRLIDWYHSNLQHPGIDRTEKTIRMHFVWPGMPRDIEQFVKTCHQCQRCKASRKKYGHLPPKEFSDVPWDTLCVDLIGPYTVTTSTGKEITLLAMTMCDPATGWFEIVEVKNRASKTTAINLDRTWFCRYPRPKTLYL